MVGNEPEVVHDFTVMDVDPLNGSTAGVPPDIGLVNERRRILRSRGIVIDMPQSVGRQQLGQGSADALQQQQLNQQEHQQLQQTFHQQQQFGQYKLANQQQLSQQQQRVQQQRANQQKMQNQQTQPQCLNESGVQSTPKRTKQKRNKKRRTNSAESMNSMVSTHTEMNSMVSTHTELSNNRFALLSDLDIVSVTADQSVDNNVYNVSSNDNADIKKLNSVANREQTAQLTQNKFLPPIVLFNVDIRGLVAQFKVKFPDMEIKIVNCSNSKSKLFIKNFDAYTEMMALLKEKQINSHSYTPDQCKQVSAILRGLHFLTSTEEIKAELDELLPNVVDNVQEFITPYMRNNSIKSNLFRVTLLPGRSINDVLAIKFLSYQSITWEKPRSVAREVQCKRCQRWGHIAKNCNHPYNCMKCDKSHGPGECLLKKSEGSKPYCTNCKQWGHPANFRGCESFKSFTALRDLRGEVRSSNRSKNITSPVVSANKSYASNFRAQGNSYASKFKNQKLINDFLLIAKQLLEPDTITIESRIENFLKNFKTMNADNRKSECMNILETLQHHNVK